MRLIPILYILAVMLLAGGVSAQDENEIPVFPVQPGTIEGNINDSTPAVRYSFEAQAGDSVTITMEATSGDLDPLLELYGPNGGLIERNDDRAPGDRSAQIALTLAQNGTYEIEAARFDPGGVSTSGTFRLTIDIAGTGVTDTPTDPLANPPNFSVDFSIIDYQTVIAGAINQNEPRQYYAIGGQRGDLVRVIMTRISGDLDPALRILDAQARPISRETQTRAGETIAFTTLPETGWYLIEASARSGVGAFDLYATRIAAEPLPVGGLQSDTFTPEAPTISYLVNARIGDTITVNMFTADVNSAVTPELRLLDLGLDTIASASGERFVTLRQEIPRSGLYIVQANNLNPGSSGGYSVRLTSVPGMEQIDAQPVAYNNRYTDEITEFRPLDYYRFAGKTGELVTLTMNATEGDLNPYLILMDSDLNELTANDDIGARRDARIAQYRLPKDGEYLILATRADLRDGVTTGAYELAITAGAITLAQGAFSATLTWGGDTPADLNLFVREPTERVVSYSDPTTPSGGRLQIDSNTGCQTPSDEPVEHIYYESPPAGDYDVWAWYQDGCGRTRIVDFTLTLRSGEEVIFEISEQLRPGQRYQVTVRITGDGQAFVLGRGQITNPTPQQAASEGGEAFIRPGETITGRIDDEVFARFYQFEGQAGDEVTITAERVTGDLDPMLVLRDANDQTLPDAVSDDAAPGVRDAALTYTLPEDGRYVIAVTRFGVREGTTAGDFALTLESGY